MQKRETVIKAPSGGIQRTKRLTPFRDRRTNTMPEKLSTEQVDLIRRTWRVVASSPEAPAALARHLTSLAPTTAKLLDVQRADRLIAVASEIIAELDANDIDTFINRLQNLRNSQVLRALDPENVPSIHRACLFSIWEVMEQTSAEVERKEAAAKQAEAVAAEMAAKAQEAARRAAEAKREAEAAAAEAAAAAAAAQGGGYTDAVAKAYSHLLELVDTTLRPEVTPEERKKMNYFHRRAPGNTIPIESPETLGMGRPTPPGAKASFMQMFSLSAPKSP